MNLLVRSFGKLLIYIECLWPEKQEEDLKLKAIVTPTRIEWKTERKSLKKDKVSIEDIIRITTQDIEIKGEEEAQEDIIDQNQALLDHTPKTNETIIDV